MGKKKKEKKKKPIHIPNRKTRIPTSIKDAKKLGLLNASKEEDVPQPSEFNAPYTFFTRKRYVEGDLKSEEIYISLGLRKDEHEGKVDRKRHDKERTKIAYTVSRLDQPYRLRFKKKYIEERKKVSEMIDRYEIDPLIGDKRFIETEAYKKYSLITKFGNSLYRPLDLSNYFLRINSMQTLSKTGVTVNRKYTATEFDFDKGVKAIYSLGVKGLDLAMTGRSFEKELEEKRIKRSENLERRVDFDPTIEPGTKLIIKNSGFNWKLWTVDSGKRKGAGYENVFLIPTTIPNDKSTESLDYNNGLFTLDSILSGNDDSKIIFEGNDKQLFRFIKNITDIEAVNPILPYFDFLKKKEKELASRFESMTPGYVVLLKGSYDHLVAEVVSGEYKGKSFKNLRIKKALRVNSGNQKFSTPIQYKDKFILTGGQDRTIYSHYNGIPKDKDYVIEFYGSNSEFLDFLPDYQTKNSKSLNWIPIHEAHGGDHEDMIGEHIDFKRFFKMNMSLDPRGEEPQVPENSNPLDPQHIKYKFFKGDFELSDFLETYKDEWSKTELPVSPNEYKRQAIIFMWGCYFTGEDPDKNFLNYLIRQKYANLNLKEQLEK